MRVGVPKEIKNHEYRVGLIPSSVLELVHHGHEVIVQKGAGLGAGLSDGDYIAAVAPEFVGIKLGGGAVVADMATLDPSAVPVLAPEGLTGAQLIALVEEAGRKGTMVNFTFHGIGGDHIQTSLQAHEELLAYLDAHRDRYWTATFLDIMTWVRGQQAQRGAASP